MATVKTLGVLFSTTFKKFLPFLSCWWVLFGLASYVEGPASELLQVYQPSLLRLFWLLWLWYLLHMAVLFLGFSLALESYWLDFPLLAAQSLAFTSAGFFLLCAARNLLTPFLAALFYEIFAMLSGTPFLRFCNLFSLSRVEHPSQLILPYGPVGGRIRHPCDFGRLGLPAARISSLRTGPVRLLRLVLLRVFCPRGRSSTSLFD